MDGQHQALRQPQARRGTLWLAFGSIALYFVALSILHPGTVADEGYHLRAVRSLCDGHWALPHYLPMFPGYHLFAFPAAKLFGANVLALRACNLVMALAAVAFVYGILRRMNAPHPGDALLHFAWNPVLFPYLVLAYTDLPAMLWTVAAVYLFLRQRFLLSALALLLACFMRQSSVVWVGMLAAWAAFDVWKQQREPQLRNDGERDSPAAIVRPLLLPILQRVWPYGLLGVAAIVLFASRGRVTFGSEQANRPAFNVAQFYLFGLFFVLLWAPTWLAVQRRDWATVFRPHLMRPSGIGILTALAALLVLSYENPHPWNQGLDYLRNWPLVAMSNSLAWRMLLCLVIVAAGCVAARHIWLQPRRGMVGLALLFACIFLLPQPLAEPRYYIAPVFFINLLTRYTARQARHLTIWYGLLSAAVATRVCLWSQPTGGVW